VNLNALKEIRKLRQMSNSGLKKHPTKKNFNLKRLSNQAFFGHFEKVIVRQNGQRLAILGCH